MRVSEEEIKRITQKIITVWKEKNLAEFSGSEHQLSDFLQAAFLKNMHAEDDLNKEVEEMLKKYEAQISAGMDRRKLFQMIKNQLVKERKLVI